MGKTFLTSDTHFGHANILLPTYCNRPWQTVEAMNEGLISNWNAVVTPEDTVFHLGDFAMGPKNLHKGYLERLNGRKILIRGNHDGNLGKMVAMGFESCFQTLYTQLDGKTVYMAHVPLGHDPNPDRYYPDEFKNLPLLPYDYWLCGHVHKAWKRKGNVINVGTDVWGYRPICLAEALTALDETLVPAVP